MFRILNSIWSSFTTICLLYVIWGQILIKWNILILILLSYSKQPWIDLLLSYSFCGCVVANKIFSSMVPSSVSAGEQSYLMDFVWGLLGRAGEGLCVLQIWIIFWIERTWHFFFASFILHHPIIKSIFPLSFGVFSLPEATHYKDCHLELYGLLNLFPVLIYSSRSFNVIYIHIKLFVHPLILYKWHATIHTVLQLDFFN